MNRHIFEVTLILAYALAPLKIPAISIAEIEAEPTLPPFDPAKVTLYLSYWLIDFRPRNMARSVHTKKYNPCNGKLECLKMKLAS
jgi:hypothetical protein